MNKHEDSDISDITDALDDEMMTDEHDNINETMPAEAQLSSAHSRKGYLHWTDQTLS